MAHKQMYAIIDIETTGGLAKRDKITEIGIVLHNGNQAIRTYQTLIHPERSIPPEITRITGITDEMVADAPRFYEVAKDIVEWTEGAIFVAHNVRFDYSFIKEEFKRLGYTFSRRQMCTVRLARQHFPGLPSYSLGQLIRYFDIQVQARHRALDDALATAEIFDMIIKGNDNEIQRQQIIRSGVKESALPKGITLDTLSTIPESYGVYYFYNTYGQIIYIGKSINIRKRVLQHFKLTSRKAERLAQMVHSIEAVETGSELIALLLESKEIKKWSPEINRAQKSKEYPFAIYSYYDMHGYINFSCNKLGYRKGLNGILLNRFSSKENGQRQLISMVKKWELCPAKCGLTESNRPCMMHAMGNCHGACTGKEDPDVYNERALMAKTNMNKMFDDDFFIRLPGRNISEMGFVLVKEGEYRGFGYIDVDVCDLSKEHLLDHISNFDPTPDANSIVYNWIAKNPGCHIIYC